MIVIMYQTVDRNPESLAKNEDRVLLESQANLYANFEFFQG
jgi:hypothetical protein